ncbi:NUMOD4 domain-containing protein [Sphingomonas endophytica]|uniref:NUMOD4 domain-containing protein n=1 Tax=Sphingomonas endophytica TaxID=869719 RepID=UPI000735EA22|nr:NUMOD4 domain-containing protein [Sphingomonas endophytica]
MSGERWKPVVGYEGLYEVSDQGRVKRLRREQRVETTAFDRPYQRQLQNLILKAQPNKNSPIVTLYRDGTRKQISVPRLVREAFG